MTINWECKACQVFGFADGPVSCWFCGDTGIVKMTKPMVWVDTLGLMRPPIPASWGAVFGAGTQPGMEQQ